MARSRLVPFKMLVSSLSCVVGCASIVGLEDKERPAGPGGAAGAGGGAAGSASGAGGASGIGGAAGAGKAGAAGTGGGGSGGAGAGGAGTGGAGKGGAGTGGAGTGGAGTGGAGTGGAGAGGAGTGGAGTGGAGAGGAGAGGGGNGGNGGAGTGGGPWLVFSLWDSDLQEMRKPPVAYRMTLDGARQDLSALLDASLGKQGDDDTVAVSRNGAFLVFTTTRGCDPDDDCIVVARNDASLSDSFLVAVKDQFTTRRPHPWGRAAISDDGLRVVYSIRNSMTPEKNTWRLFTATRADAKSNVWSEEIQITTESEPVTYASAPVFSADPTRVLFGCSPNLPVQSDEGMSVCETGVADGAGRVTLVDASTLLGPMPAKNTASHPTMRADGFLFFTGEPSGGTTGRQVWVRKSPGNLSIVTDFAQDYDHSPCVLPDGRLVSIWGKHPTFVHNVAVKIVPATLVQDAPTYLEMLPAGIKDTQFVGPSLTCGGLP